MTDPDLIKLFVTRLEAISIPYMITGGVAAVIFGDPRFTRDINIVHRDTGLRAHVYVRGKDPLHAWAFERRIRLPVEETRIWVAPVEYVILRKLQYFRTSGSERHLRDVAMMLRISGDSIDASELAGWAQRLELHEVLEAARRFAG